MPSKSRTHKINKCKIKENTVFFSSNGLISPEIFTGSHKYTKKD